MSISELVTTQHLTRQAIIYIRQSTPHQVLTNQESLRLQYALKQRALSLGWRDDQIEIIDADLGLTGAAAQHREGFKELLAKVTLEQALVFDTFFQRRAASKVLQYFNQQQLLLPVRDRSRELAWKPPTVGAILSILKNPAYAGAFVYGRNTYKPRTATGRHTIVKRLPMEKWKIRVNDKYPSYISWETFEKIQAMLRDNHAEYTRNRTRGVPRSGQALLHGLLYGGEWAHKMVVQSARSTYYICDHLRRQSRAPVCQCIPGDPVDQAVLEAFFQALSPVELDVYAQAMAAHRQKRDQVRQASGQKIERIRYQAKLDQRQLNSMEPDNRLVAAELEARWEAALRELKQAEESAAQADQVV